MYVYRVEHKNQRVDRGPYTLGLAYKPHLFDENHPSPEQSGIQMSAEWNSCFAKESDLTKWFKRSDLTWFKEFDFDTFRYEVKADDVQLGDKQAAFRRDRAFKRQKVTLH